MTAPQPPDLEEEETDPLFEAIVTPEPKDRHPEKIAGAPQPADLLTQIRVMWDEAKQGRESGHSARDHEWEANWQAFWSQYDFSKKAEWQSQERMPEVANYVERFSAAMRLALTANPQWYSIEDTGDPGGTLNGIVQKILEFSLERSGENDTGQPISFKGTFGECVKAGALMNMVIAVTWRDGRVRIDPVDARELWLDPTGRNRYRIRKRLMDWAELKRMAKENPDLWDMEAIDNLKLTPAIDEDQYRKEASAGHSKEEAATPTGRVPVEVYEFLGRLVNEDGEYLEEGEKVLVMVGDMREIIRGPERNPFDHKQDWIISVPLLRVPFSTYHRSYVETFRQLANTFNEMTNLILDAVFANSINAHQAWPSLMEDPNELLDGVHPGKVFQAAEDTPPGMKFIVPVELGDHQAVQTGFLMWQGLKQELREGAHQNELQLGQFAPKGEVTATEVAGVQQGARSLLAGISEDLEDYGLSPMLELVWLTAVQHITDEDAQVVSALGEENVAAVVSNRDEFLKRRFRFRAKGISGVLERQTRARGLITALNIVGSNPMLAGAFMSDYSVTRTLDAILTDLNVQVERLKKSEQEKKIEAVMKAQAGGPGMPGMPGAPGAPAPPGAQQGRGMPSAPAQPNGGVPVS